VTEQQGEEGRVQALDDRFDAIEAEQAEQKGLIGQVLDAVKGTGPAHAGAQRVVQARLDAPGSVAEEVRAELARRDKDTRDAEIAAKVGTHDETLAKLTEKQPETPVRRVERIMGWGRS
jgi:hypothetical protein